MTNEVERLANDHWDWLEPILRMSGSFRPDQLPLVRYLFTTAMLHGYKHGREGVQVREDKQ